MISLARKHTLCRLEIHCPKRKRVQKLSGGEGAQLCCYCRTIMSYGTENT